MGEDSLCFAVDTESDEPAMKHHSSDEDVYMLAFVPTAFSEAWSTLSQSHRSVAFMLESFKAKRKSD